MTLEASSSFFFTLHNGVTRSVTLRLFWIAFTELKAEDPKIGHANPKLFIHEFLEIKKISPVLSVSGLCKEINDSYLHLIKSHMIAPTR